MRKRHFTRAPWKNLSYHIQRSKGEAHKRFSAVSNTGKKTVNVNFKVVEEKYTNIQFYIQGKYISRIKKATKVVLVYRNLNNS